MCGRFTLTRPDLEQLARELGAAVDAETVRLHRPRWNIAPTTHAILLLDAGGRRLVPARFGIEVPGGGLVINARSETAARLRTFRNSFAHARCVVPTDGFYEWQGGRAERRPVWFHPPDRGLLLLAGLAFERDGRSSFVILTTGANDLVRPLHDRMPVLLSRDDADAWLARPDDALLAPAAAGALLAREVSSLVNDVANDGPDLLAPPSPARQLSLL